MLADVCHCVELLLADLARELLLGVAVHYLDVLVQRPQLLEGLVAGDTLQDTNEIKIRGEKFTGEGFGLVIKYEELNLTDEGWKRSAVLWLPLLENCE